MADTPELKFVLKRSFARTSWVSILIMPLCLTASVKILRTGGGTLSRKLKIASDSSFPRAKAFATDVADCHSCLQQHSVLQNSVRLKDEENMVLKAMLKHFAVLKLLHHPWPTTSLDNLDLAKEVKGMWRPSNHGVLKRSTCSEHST